MDRRSASMACTNSKPNVPNLPQKFCIQSFQACPVGSSTHPKLPRALDIIPGDAQNGFTLSIYPSSASPSHAQPQDGTSTIRPPGRGHSSSTYPVQLQMRRLCGGGLNHLRLLPLGCGNNLGRYRRRRGCSPAYQGRANPVFTST